MLSISIMTFDIESSRTVLDLGLGRRTSAPNISNTVRDTMLDTMEIR